MKDVQVWGNYRTRGINVIVTLMGWGSVTYDGIRLGRGWFTIDIDLPPRRGLS